jgi:putative colanic acid biosynthesis glycosyltransferase WcaI
MKIVYLSHYYPPEMGAPAGRVSAFARRWAAAGHDVTVLTTFPNHPTGVIRPEYRGRVFQVEDDRGVRVVRTYLYAAPNKGVVKRGLCYASFMISSVLQGYAPIGRPDLVVASSPQFLVLLSGWALTRLKGVPFVAEIRDLWPDSIVAVGALAESSPIVRGLARLERFVYRQADLTISVTRSFVPILRQRGSRRVAVVPNGADVGQFAPEADRDALKRRFGLSGRFVASFVGTLGMAHGLDTVLEAAERLAKSHPTVLFWLVGEGARRAELEAEAKRRGLVNVRFEGQVPRADVPAVLAASDVALVLLKPTPIFDTVLPSKMFEAMAAGCPVILGARGEACEVLEESGAGTAVTPGSAEELARAVAALAVDPAERARKGASGRRFVAARFHHDALAVEYLETLRDLVESKEG